MCFSISLAKHTGLVSVPEAGHELPVQCTCALATLQMLLLLPAAVAAAAAAVAAAAACPPCIQLSMQLPHVFGAKV
jgi:hypothetical protein